MPQAPNRRYFTRHCAISMPRDCIVYMTISFSSSPCILNYAYILAYYANYDAALIRGSDDELTSCYHAAWRVPSAAIRLGARVSRHATPRPRRLSNLLPSPLTLIRRASGCPRRRFMASIMIMATPRPVETISRHQHALRRSHATAATSRL